MAERKVLQGDRRRLDEQGAKEGPETNHEDHRGPPAVWHLNRHSTGAGVAVVREVQAGQADGLLDRDRVLACGLVRIVSSQNRRTRRSERRCLAFELADPR
jgi:hypothetical protein